MLHCPSFNQSNGAVRFGVESWHKDSKTQPKAKVCAAVEREYKGTRDAAVASEREKEREREGVKERGRKRDGEREGGAETRQET